MEGQSRFLPESVSGALKNIARRAWGTILILVGAWAVFALLFFNPYLDGFATASTFGNQSVMGNVVAFLRYSVGTVPASFL